MPYKFQYEHIKLKPDDDRRVRLTEYDKERIRIQFLEGKARGAMFKRYPPKTIYVSRTRIKCALCGDFKAITSSATCYAWYVWQKGYTGDTVIKWIN